MIPSHVYIYIYNVCIYILIHIIYIHMYIMSIVFIYQHTWYHHEFANQTDHGIILT